MKEEDVKDVEVNNHKTNEDDVFYDESDGLISASRLLSLLGSKDRDSLLSPTGTQVSLPPSFLPSLSLSLSYSGRVLGLGSST